MLPEQAGFAVSLGVRLIHLIRVEVEAMAINPQRLFGVLALVFVILCNAAGNLLLKIGANPALPKQVFGIYGWHTITGIACFAAGILCYAWALKQFDLYAAQIVVSVQYVVVILLAAAILGERISIAQWSGIGLIAAGLFICSR